MIVHTSLTELIGLVFAGIIILFYIGINIYAAFNNRKK